MTQVTRADLAVGAEGLSKRYRRWGKTRAFGTLKSAFLGRGLAEALSPSESVEALSGVSFEVRKGETFGVIGANGSGKSTLLKLVAGIFKPSAGHLVVNGKVSALIELGAGFHPEISGRENVVINGVMLGLTKKEIERKLPEIVEFSGLEDFIDQPVKTYSSGMYVRLGFAVAVHVDPDILVVDEVLAVGDEAFSRRCLDTIAEFSARGKTIFFVSHSLVLVEELCDRVLYLEGGKVKGLGDAREMLAAYRLDVAEKEGERLKGEHGKDQEILLKTAPVSAAPARFSGTHETRSFSEGENGRAAVAPERAEAIAEQDARGFFLEGEKGKEQSAGAESLGRTEAHSPFEEKTPVGEASRPQETSVSVPSPLEQKISPRPRRWGNRDVSITACRLLDVSGVERYSFKSGETITIEIDATPSRSLSDFVFGIAIFTPEDVCVHGSNTETDGFEPALFAGPARVRVTLPRCDLGAGTYLVDVAVHSRRDTPYDYWRGACRFAITSPDRDAGLYRPERRWSFEGVTLRPR